MNSLKYIFHGFYIYFNFLVLVLIGEDVIDIVLLSLLLTLNILHTFF